MKIFICIVTGFLLLSGCKMRSSNKKNSGLRMNAGPEYLLKTFGLLNNDNPAVVGHTKAVNSVAFSPSGNHFVSASWDHTVKLWNMQTGELLNTFGAPNNRDPAVGHTGLVYSVAFLPYSINFLSASSDHTVKLWNTGLRKPPKSARSAVRYSE